MSKMKKFLALMCATTMMLTACGAPQSGDVADDSSSVVPSSSQTESSVATPDPTEAPVVEVYPLQTNVKLTYWSSLSSTITAYTDNFGNTDYAKELSKRTGVAVDYIHPADGATNAMQLMLTEKVLPDLMEADWNSYGPDKALTEGSIIALNDLIDQYAPNFKKYLDENPDIKKLISTADGTIYCFPFIRGNDRLLISKGMLIRQDWLDELGLAMPETVADLEKVLIAFRDQKGAEIPMTERSNKANILGLFSTSSDFYLENGKVVYGPLTDNYKTALETLRRWYAEGLLDPNYGANSKQVLESNVLTGKSGVTFNTGGGGLGGWLDTAAAQGIEFNMVGAPYTAISADQPVTYFPIDSPYVGGGSVAISTSCKNPEIAVQFLDYAYGEEGHILCNFGTEGVSYDVVDGKMVYNDNIYNNPNGLTSSQAMSNYFRASLNGPFVQDAGYIDQFYYRPGQQTALDNWTKNIEVVKQNTIPAAVKSYRTAEENEEYTNILVEIQKLEKAMFANVLKGIEPMEAYDKFVQDCKALKVDRVIAIDQAAYDRYMAQ